MEAMGSVFLGLSDQSLFGWLMEGTKLIKRRGFFLSRELVFVYIIDNLPARNVFRYACAVYPTAFCGVFFYGAEARS